MEAFADRLAGAVRRCGTPLLVGLDPRGGQLPLALMEGVDLGDPSRLAAAYAVFCREVIDVVAPMVPAVKPQAAFFEALGPPGMRALWETIAYAKQNGLLVIADGKRSDIGSTAAAYADAWLGDQSAWGADALTVNPYLGGEGLQPFVDVATERGAGIFVLVKTSNPGGGMFQDLVHEGQTVYQYVGRYMEELAEKTLGQSGYGAVGSVVGATYPEQLADLRRLMPHAWILVPGFGAQGGTAEDAAGAFAEDGLGAIVNSSRGIIFAHRAEAYAERFGEARWQQAVEAATHDAIRLLREGTPAGRLTG